MSCRPVSPHLHSAFRPRGRRAARRARRLANAQTDLLPELLVVSPSLVPIEASKTGSSVTAMTGEEIARERLLAALRRDAHVSRHARQPVRLARLADAIPRARRGGEPPAGDDRRRAGECGRRRRIQFRRHSAGRHRARRTAARAAVRPLRRERAFRRAHHRHQIGARARQAGIQRARSRAARSARPKAPRPARGAARPGLRLDHRRPTRPPTASTSRATASETDGAKRFAVTGKAGIDFTPNFNVEGFVRHSRRKAEADPQDPFFLNTGLVEDAPRLFHQRPTKRSRASKARSSCSTIAGSSRRNGPARGQISTAFENFAQSSVVARDRRDARPTRARCCSTR